jgi:hypothetical protein
MPRAQLSQVADRMSVEASGIVTANPDLLQGPGAQRLVVSYLNEQVANAMAVRKECSDSQQRERDAVAEVSTLREKLAVAHTIIESEKRLRAPRTLLSFLGLGATGMGVDQLAGKDATLGVILVVVGILIVGSTYLLAPAEGNKQ